MHDYSRDIMLATSQEAIEMKMSLVAAEMKGRQMQEQLKKLDVIQKRTDELLYQMIPKACVFLILSPMPKFYYPAISNVA